MEEVHIIRHWNRNTELHATAVSRSLWQRVTSQSAAEIYEPGRCGPYETSYDVARGYCAERPILQP